MLPVILLSGLVAASPASPPSYGGGSGSGSSKPAVLPLKYRYGDYPRVTTDIFYGTPQQSPAIPTIVDLGSADYWVYGPNATINYGSQYLGVMGPCNITAKPSYNPSKSRTASKRKNVVRGYAYGGNGKLVSSYFDVNDTIAFGSADYPAFANRNVAISNFTLIKQLATAECAPIEYDRSILGLSRFVGPGSKTPEPQSVGPSFRQGLLAGGLIESSTLSMWFDAAPADVRGTFAGTALFGAVPRSKYAGELVQVKPSPPTDAYVGYYAARPVFKAAPVSKPGAKQVLKLSDKVPRCLIDSGSGQDSLPIAQDEFLKATGLVEHGGYPAFDGPCDKIPRNATIDYTFAGLNGKSVTIKVPLRNYARGNTDYLGDKNKCGLSMELGSVGSCTFGAPFFTGAFIAINDEKNQIALAQGGVSQGAAKGVNGLGAVTTVKKGQGLP